MHIAANPHNDFQKGTFLKGNHCTSSQLYGRYTLKSSPLFLVIMNWIEYQKRFKLACHRFHVSKQNIEKTLIYAQNLFNNKVPIIHDVKHLSLLLGYKTELLYKVTNDPSKFYRKFKILKRNGKLRKINEPYPTVKEIQYWILNNILQKIEISPFAKAYVKKRNIRDNARFHKGQRIVINLDVRNYFESITVKKVYSIFLNIGYTQKVSSVLASLCCLYNHLPQGAPTSPVLSNIYAKDLDKRISSYTIKNKLRYTRYSDDITISGDISDDRISSIINFVKMVLRDNDLKMNDSKTKILRANNRQMVTGVVVNSKLSIQRKIKKNIRQEMYYIMKFGIDSHIARNNITKRNYIGHIKGKINWILSIEKNNNEFLKYKQFLR